MPKKLTSSSIEDAVAVYQALGRDTTVALFSRLETKVVAQLLKAASKATACSDAKTAIVADRLATAVRQKQTGNDASAWSTDCSTREQASIDAIASLDDAQIRLLLKTLDTSCWAPALKRASRETRDRVFCNMAAPAAAILRAEIGQLVSVSAQEISVAVAEIQKAVAVLPKDGELHQSHQKLSRAS